MLLPSTLLTVRLPSHYYSNDKTLTQHREDPGLWYVQQRQSMTFQLTSAGAFLKNYPMVLGTDVAGEVHEVGEGVTHVKKGDRVLGYVHPIHVTTHTYHNRLTATPSRS